MKPFQETYAELQSFIATFDSNLSKRSVMQSSLNKYINEHSHHLRAYEQNQKGYRDVTRIGFDHSCAVSEQENEIKQLIPSQEQTNMLTNLLNNCIVSLHVNGAVNSQQAYLAMAQELQSIRSKVTGYLSLSNEPVRRVRRHQAQPISPNDPLTLRNVLAMLPDNVISELYIPYLHHFLPKPQPDPRGHPVYDLQVQLETLISNKASFYNVILAIATDNVLLFNYFTNQIAEAESLKVQDYIANHNLHFLAITMGSSQTMKSMIKSGVSLEMKCELPVTITTPTNGQYLVQKQEVHTLTALGLAVHLGPKYKPDVNRKMLELLLNAGASFNAKAVVKWNEQRGYLGANTVEMKQVKNLVDYDQAGIILPLINERKSRKSKKTQSSDYQGTNDAPSTGSPSMKNLLERVSKLESEGRSMRKEITFLKATVTRLANASSTSRETSAPALPVAHQAKDVDTSRERQADMRCRFFVVDKPNSCRNGEDCGFEHARKSGM